ncbi:TrlF family AAA-like ATPase [Capnocytophaga gingivalis]|uniref:TrlF family AAA-like ATPase n=1 Tax=Capnocytophaga gingivalis TaxID=1017 RepID=UPI0028E31CFC|nr:hypothetical protein [Capnocytophaga gingivalis]
MTTNIAINRGSEWRKWDLHVHTPLSIEQEYGGNTPENWERFISNLERLPSEIKVIGINDYIFIDGYKKVLDEKQKGRLSNIELILPVIELRIDKFANVSENEPFKRVNFHIIFSNELTPEIIQEQFLNSLSCEYILNSDLHDKSIWNGTITIKSITDLGQKIIDSSNGKINGSPLKIGFNSLNIPYNKLLEKLENSYLKNKFLTAVGKTEWDTMRWDGSVADKKNVINRANFVFSASPTVELAVKARESLKSQSVNHKLLHCSDAHTFINNLQNTKEKELGHCFTWIKADPTFEGLKQIIYEYGERVKIQDEKPDFKEDKEIIDEIRFISPSNKFRNGKIYLNPNLNVIIGGKSSGKSILLYSIAKTLLADTKDKLLFKNNEEERYSIKSIDSGFDFEITTKAGFSQKISDREKDDYSVIPNIKYIPQNELVKLAEPELSGKGESLNKIVRHLIREDYDSNEKYNDFIKNVKQYDKEREELIDNYFDTLDNIQKLEAELKTKSNKEVLQTNIKTNSEKVEELNKKAGLSDEQIQQYKSIQEQQQQNQKRRDLLNSDFSQTNAFLQELNKELSNLQERKNTFLQSIHKNEFRGYYQDKLKFIDDSIVQLQGLISEIGIIINSEGKRIFNTDNIFKKELKQINYEKSNIEEELKPYQQNEDIKKQIRTLEEFIENDGKLLSEIDSLNKKIEEKRQSIEEIKTKLFDLYKNSYNEYIDIVEQLKNRTIELEKDGLQIRGVTQFNFPKFRREIISFTHGTYNDNDKYCILDENRSRIFETNYDELISNISKMFNEIMTSEYRIKTISKKEAVKKLLNDYFYDYWEITYKNDKLGEMSTGKASFVILMLIIGLSKSKSPILIDQPEDNLDNRSVTKDLVSYLKMKKIERQIILVTHNANIVVNADAENVIVANQKGQNDKETNTPYQFDYINGAIENTFKDPEEQDLLKSMGIREHITEILEGGETAFKNREKKYGF